MDPVATHSLDPFLRLALRTFPDALHARASARLVNHLLRGQTLSARLSALEGRSVCLHLTDVPCWLYFRVERGRVTAGAPGAADATIRTAFADVKRLALRLEDPDTLFFSRRLCLEGNTEIGLHVKNLIDAFDFDPEAHFRDVLGTPLGELTTALWRHVRGLFKN